MPKLNLNKIQEKYEERQRKKDKLLKKQNSIAIDPRKRREDRDYTSYIIERHEKIYKHKSWSKNKAVHNII